MNRSQITEMFETANTEIMRNYGHERFDHDKAVELLEMMIDSLRENVRGSGTKSSFDESRWLSAMRHRLYKERKAMIRKWWDEERMDRREAREEFLNS